MPRKMSFADRIDYSFPILCGNHFCDEPSIVPCQEVVDGQIIGSSRLVPPEPDRFKGVSFRDFSVDNVLAVDGLLPSPTVVVNRSKVNRNNLLLSQLDTIDLTKFVPDEKD